MRIYFDHNATTPLAAEVGVAIQAALAIFGNPSSIHEDGRAARDLLETSRTSVAGLVGGSAGDIVFTSGGTEADCLGMISLARLRRSRGGPPRVITAAIEHPAVHGAAGQLVREGFEVAHVRLLSSGHVDLEDLEEKVRVGAAVIGLALANHELGTVQDIPAAAAIAHRYGALFHCDAVQAAGKLPLRVAALGVDSLAISAHKIYGPKGVGALWVRPDLPIEPVVAAGHQERERRPGTENLLGIVGMGAAAALVAERLEADRAHVAALASRLEAGLVALSGVRIHGEGAPRIGNTVNAGFAGALGEVIVAALDIAGISASTGAACTSGSVKPSPVLLGIGLPAERAVEAVRFSLGRHNTEADVDALLACLPEILERARQFR